MKSLFHVGALVVAGLVAVGCNSDPNSNLSITSIEIIQGTQTSTNTVELVAQRSTTVRVMLDTGSSNSIANVSGLLSVKVNGAFITPVGGIAALNQPITVPASPDRNAENDSLYFELEAPSGITASSDVDFFVVVAGNGQLVQGEVPNQSFVDKTTPNIYYMSIDYTPAGLGFPAAALIDPGVGDAFVKGIYPVDDDDATFYQVGPFPSGIFTQDTDGNGLLDGSDDNDLLSALATVRNLFPLVGVGVSSNTFIYGWLAGNPIPGNGLGQVGGNAAFGNTEEIRHQRTFAHELGHNFGLDHNSRTLDQTGWDTSARLDSNPATNNTSGRVKDTGMFDIMVGGKRTNTAWVDTTTYNFFLGSPILASLGAVRLQEAPVKGTLTVHGRFDPSGQKLERVEPAFRFPWPMEPTRERQGDPYMIEVRDDVGTIHRRTFNALVGDDSPSEKQRFGFFEVILPFPPERKATSLRIRDAKNPEKIYLNRTASEPPKITVTAPQPGASLDSTTEVRWQVDDPDSKPADMQFQIAYSKDAGQSFVPLKVDLDGNTTSAVVNTRQIPKGDGKGLIRVLVSDGLNTAIDDVENLSTPRAIF